MLLAWCTCHFTQQYQLQLTLIYFQLNCLHYFCLKAMKVKRYRLVVSVGFNCGESYKTFFVNNVATK